MSARHPLPYTFAKANAMLLEDDGETLVLHACERTPLSALAEVGRRWPVARHEHEPEAQLAQRIAAVSAGGESSAAAVIGEVESGVDLSRMMQELPAVEDLLEAADDAPIIRMLNALLTQAAHDGASDIHIEPYERSSAVRFRVDRIDAQHFRQRRQRRALVGPQHELLAVVLQQQRVRLGPGVGQRVAGAHRVAPFSSPPARSPARRAARRASARRRRAQRSPAAARPAARRGARSAATPAPG